MISYGSMAQNITFNLGDNKDASVNIQIIRAVRLEIKLDFKSIDYGHQTLDIMFCYYLDNINLKITYLRRPIYCIYTEDIPTVRNLIHSMKKKLSSYGSIINWIATDMYWIHSSDRRYQDPVDGSYTKFKIKLCEESKKQFIDELQGFIHILNTIDNKGIIGGKISK